jgi:hypothetical protein
MFESKWPPTYPGGQLSPLIVQQAAVDDTLLQQGYCCVGRDGVHLNDIKAG